MYAVKVENHGDERYLATSRGYPFVLGIHGEGANPGDVLLAALCGCVGHYARQVLRQRGLGSRGFVLSAEAGSTADGSRLARIDVRIEVGPWLDEAGQREVVAAARRCKILNTLEAACPVTVTLGVQGAGEAREAEGATARGCCA